MIRFAGQTAIVTAAAHGFGRAIALGFAREGAQVWGCDLLEDELAETRALAAGMPGAIEVRRVDVTDRPAVLAFAAEARAATGRIDILVNNAGGVLGQVGQPLEHVTPEQWQGIFDVNASGPFWFAQAVAPAMKAAGRGRIITISSGAGLGISLTGIQAYASAKAASIALTRQLGHELGPFGITVNCVAPGFVRSNPASEKQWQSYGEAGQRALVEGIALRRLGTPDDIANAVLFFASDAAAWVTGQTLSVDGGR